MRQHPIEKMQSAFLRAHYKKGNVISDARILARHVKPLLDALEKAHKAGWRTEDSSRCEVCRHLAGWKEPLD